MNQTTHNSDITIDPFILPQVLYKNAKHQLHVSCGLYLLHQYPDSVFHLQQALELLAKAFVTASTNSTNIKAFGHDICNVVPNVWKDIEKDWLNPNDPNHLQKSEIAEYLKESVVKNTFDGKNSVSKELQAIYALPLPKLLEYYQSEIWKNNSQNIRTDKAKKLFGVEHSTEEIQQYLNDIRTAGVRLQKTQKILKHGVSDEEILRFFDTLTRPSKTRSPTYQKVKEQERLKKYKNTYFKTKEDKKTTTDLIFIFHSSQMIPEMLLPLSYLIQEHQQPSRYLDPTNPLETDPLIVYNRKHYLIKNYIFLYRHMCSLARNVNRDIKFLMQLDNAGILKKVAKLQKKHHK